MSDTLLSPLAPAFPVSRPAVPQLVLRAPPRHRLPGIAAPLLQGDDEATIRVTPMEACPAGTPPGAAAAPGILGWIVAMWRARRSRHDLAGLDDRMLGDIGVSRLEALDEAGRWPWDLGPRGSAAR